LHATKCGFQPNKLVLFRIYSIYKFYYHCLDRIINLNIYLPLQIKMKINLTMSKIIISYYLQVRPKRPSVQLCTRG
jgi:hypothetical protein